jgi:hypothetical protein
MEKKYDLLSHKLYALYVRVHREITDAGYAVPPMCWRRWRYYTWNIFDTKAWRPFQFWRRSSVRNSLFCSPMLLWPLSWMSVSKRSDRELDLCFPIRIPSFWLIVLPSEFMFLKILLPVFFVTLNWNRISRPNKACSRWLFVRYLSALIAKVNVTFDHVANGGRKHEYSFNVPFLTDFKLFVRTKLKNINCFHASSWRGQLWCGY